MMISRAMGARKPGPQGEREISVKTIAQGMPDDLAEPVVPSPCFLLCTGAMGEAFTRHSLRPLRCRGCDLPNSSGASARAENADAHPQGLFDNQIGNADACFWQRATKQCRRH